MNGTSPSEVNEMTAITDESIESGVLETPKTLVVVVLGDSPFILIDGEPLEIPQPISPNRDTVSITLLDVHKMLQNGALLNDQVIHGYMNLLGTQFGGLLSLRVISTHFYAKLAQSRNWNLVNRWVQEIGNTGTNWETAPIIVMPIFLGPNGHGHWSNLLVDRLASESLPGGLQFYANSLKSAHFSSEKVCQALEESPLSTASNAAT
jgi:Ulp1 family protease